MPVEGEGEEAPGAAGCKTLQATSYLEKCTLLSTSDVGVGY